MTTTFRTYRVKDLKRNPKNPGGTERYQEQELRALGKSLRQRQWMPVIVKEPEDFLLDGNRRLAAAVLEGIETLFGIPVTEEMTPAEINRLIAQLDLRHQPFSEIQRGKLWLAIRQDTGWTNAQLSEDLGISAGFLTKVFGNLENPEEIQRMVDDKILSVLDGYHLSRIEDVTERLRLAHELAGGRVKTESLAGLVRKKKQQAKGTEPAIRVGRIRCPMSSGTVIQVTFPNGGGIDDAVESVQEWLREARKASRQGLDAKTFERVCRDKAASGSDR